jgi:hypothetical protein
MDLTIGVGDDATVPASVNVSSSAGMTPPGPIAPVDLRVESEAGKTGVGSVMPEATGLSAESEADKTGVGNVMPEAAGLSVESEAGKTGVGSGMPVAAGLSVDPESEAGKTGVTPRRHVVDAADEPTPTPAYRENVALMNARTLRIQRMMDAQCKELEQSIFACEKCSSLQQKLDEQTKKIVELTELLAAKTAEWRVCSEALRQFEAKVVVIQELKKRLQQRNIDLAARERQAVENALRAEGQIRQREIEMQRRENQMLRSHMQSREQHMQTMNGFIRCNMLGLVGPPAILPPATSTYSPAQVSEVPYAPPPSSALPYTPPPSSAVPPHAHVPSTPLTVPVPHLSVPQSQGSFAAMDPTAAFMSPPRAASTQYTVNVEGLSFDELNGRL